MQILDITKAYSNNNKFKRFINIPLCRITGSLLDWWCREEQRLKYLRLHQIAIDILSIPPMSDDAERVFLGARRTVSWDRAHLGVANIEKTEYMGNWNKNSLIRQLYVVIGDDVVDVSGSDGEA